MSLSSEISTTDKQEDEYASSLYRFIRDHVPKIELHAHLNGCIPLPVLRELCEERQVTLSSLVLQSSSSSWNYSQKESNERDSKNNGIGMLSSFYNVHPRSLEDCFQIFRELPRAVNDLNAVRRITRAALSNFAYHHHVVYLELRSTPKRLLYQHTVVDHPNRKEKQLCTKQEYVETILEILQEFNEKEEQRYQNELQQQQQNQTTTTRLPMVCKFLVSVDRSQSILEATENIDLAILLLRNSSFGNEVVGVDLGGDPTSALPFEDFQPLFQKARNAGLKVTIHCAEIPCDPPQTGDEEEVDTHPAAPLLFREAESILEFRPDRIGHGVLLPSVLLQKLRTLQIPVETCPTSNVMTLQLHHHHPNNNNNNNNTIDDDQSNHGHLVHGLRQHKTLQHWLQESHPLAVSTDDPGVFDTSPTQELWLLRSAFQLSRQHMIQLATNAIRFAFCDETTKQIISERIGKHLVGWDNEFPAEHSI
jgi:adenosine deaminase